MLGSFSFSTIFSQHSIETLIALIETSKNLEITSNIECRLDRHVPPEILDKYFLTIFRKFRGTTLRVRNTGIKFKFLEKNATG